MTGSNGSQGQSQGLDFNRVMDEAKSSGNFDLLIESAKESSRLFQEFREAILAASFPGKHAPAITAGLKLLDNMIQQAVGQINTFKQMEKQTRDELKNGEGHNA